MHIRFRNDFNQRRTGTIQIDKRMIAIVCLLTGIRFQVGVMDAYCNGRTVKEWHVNVSGTDRRVIHLGNLITHGQIRIKIVLPIEPTYLCYLCIQRLCGANG